MPELEISLLDFHSAVTPPPRQNRELGWSKTGRLYYHNLTVKCILLRAGFNLKKGYVQTYNPEKETLTYTQENKRDTTTSCALSENTPQDA